MQSAERIVATRVFDIKINMLKTAAADSCNRCEKNGPGTLPPSSEGPPGLYNLNPYRRLSDHVYADVTTDENWRRLARDSAPNRHATVYGLIVYSSMQNRLNAIFLADYIFLVISLVKRVASVEPTR